MFTLPKSPTFAQKKKWAKTHRITHPTIRASCKLYDPDPVEASEGGLWVVVQFGDVARAYRPWSMRKMRLLLYGRRPAEYSSRSFWARGPGLITANFLVQS